jgi:hypothetical protein
MVDPNYAQETIELIQKNIQGRIAHEQHNCNYLAWAIAQAGNGNHLEIGTLFGGSAILAALVKKQLGFSGDVWCIDPLNGYYIGTDWQYPVDPVTGKVINEEVVWANARTFGVEDRIHIIAKPSLPWPEEAQHLLFASAFIDGNHWDHMPEHDWNMVAPRTDHYVVFDNYDDTHPAVVTACHKANNSQGWVKEFSGGITYILRRVR